MSERPDSRLTPAERILRRSADDTQHGRPLSSRARQAQRSVENYLKGGNPPRWMERIAEIDARTARELGELEEAWQALRAEHDGDREAFAAAWRAVAHARDFDELNALIRQHNDWYPVERDLPFDPRTGEYLKVHGRSYLRPLLGPEWVLERFPAE
ncbi:hypothetical protein [Conexibacter arvalis]|uniref:Uncharacterized protein n=1 Tax=Conexibacter arvalis TaxID=912552 RepID=A0A840IG60_9ACTN|nr:hypothetical protein [Conexibacter arvalis]MBB4663786.1 hypothetical protein [Conexibacter arvalis]